MYKELNTDECKLLLLNVQDPLNKHQFVLILLLNL